MGTLVAPNRIAEGEVEVSSPDRILLPGLSDFRWVTGGVPEAETEIFIRISRNINEGFFPNNVCLVDSE
jgi:hypothetical protein